MTWLFDVGLVLVVAMLVFSLLELWRDGEPRRLRRRGDGISRRW
jgi:hypothetical protein